jgi:hypothetical protein
VASNSEGWVPRWHSRATRARWVPLEGSCSLTEFSLRLLPSAVGGFTLFSCFLEQKCCTGKVCKEQAGFFSRNREKIHFAAARFPRKESRRA